MLYSMTGFGRAVNEVGSRKYTVEAKSLNSKQMDLSLRMPVMFRECEMAVRDKIAKTLERGKVDVNVFVESTGTDADLRDNSIEINLPAVHAVKAKIKEISVELGIPEPADWYQLIFRFPEVLHNDRPLPVADDSETRELERAIDECIESLIDFRKKEGAALEIFFKGKIRNIRDLLSDIEKYEAERIEKIKERIIEGLKKLPQVEHDKNRLEQEMIFYIEKLDVSEEKQRLAQHLDYFEETIGSSRPGQGKKLGFIAQEIGREINTLGSKSNHAMMQKIVVRMKDELEQIKEQVLNVM